MARKKQLTKKKNKSSEYPPFLSAKQAIRAKDKSIEWSYYLAAGAVIYVHAHRSKGFNINLWREPHDSVAYPVDSEPALSTMPSIDEIIAEKSYRYGRNNFIHYHVPKSWPSTEIIWQTSFAVLEDKAPISVLIDLLIDTDSPAAPSVPAYFRKRLVFLCQPDWRSRSRLTRD